MTDRAYYLTLPELYMLVGKGGKESLFGFGGDAQEPTEQELVMCMHHMVRKGLLQNEGSYLALQADLREIIRRICDASRCLVLQFADPTRTPMCCYFGAGGMIVSEPVPTAQKPSVRLKVVDAEEALPFFTELLQDQRTELQVYGLPEDAEDASTEALDYLKQNGFQMAQAQITALDAVVWTADCICAEDGQTLYRCILVDNALQMTLLELEPDYAAAVPYSLQAMQTQIRNWIL